MAFVKEYIERYSLCPGKKEVQYVWMERRLMFCEEPLLKHPTQREIYKTAFLYRFQSLGIICESLQLPPNVRTNGSCNRLPGNGCHFTCERGFNLIGSEIMWCNNDGSWTGTQPRCDGKLTQNWTYPLKIRAKKSNQTKARILILDPFKSLAWNFLDTFTKAFENNHISSSETNKKGVMMNFCVLFSCYLPNVIITDQWCILGM